MDSSVRTMVVGKSNKGWIPNESANAQSMPIIYNFGSGTPPQNQWMPFSRSDTGSDIYPGYFAWTRGGLRGTDFGGGEIDTGQAPAP